MVKVIIPPATEPVSLAELKLHLRGDSGSGVEDSYLSDLITAAREYCEGYQRRAYITQTLELTLDEFPVGVIELPRGSLQKVLNVTYTTADGTAHNLSEGTDYIVSCCGVLGRVSPVNVWPSDKLYPVGGVNIQFICGYGEEAKKVPLRVKQAIYMLAAYWYDNRSAVLVGNTSKPLEFSVKALLGLDRIAVI